MKGQGWENLREKLLSAFWILSMRRTVWWGSPHLAPACGLIPSIEFIVSDFPLLSHLDVLFVFPSKVQSFGERIVLFILNVVIFGRLERNLDDDDMFFLPHSVKEEAKILWRDGAAVGFYTTKRKGKGHAAVWGHCHFRLCGGGFWVSACLGGLLEPKRYLERIFWHEKYH